MVVASAHAARVRTDFPHDAPVLAAEFEIQVQEKKKRLTPTVLHSPPGTVRFTVVVPNSARRPHGVGIDGGVYHDVKGAAVNPGHRTSLTVDVKPGRYVIFDSYRNNRRKGFRSKLIVNEHTP